MPRSVGRRSSATGSIERRSGCAACVLVNRSVFKDLDPESLEYLGAHRKRREYRPGQVVFAMGDSCGGLHCVSTGTVGLRRLDERGNSVLLRMAYPGDALGYCSMVQRRDHLTSCEALGPSHVCYLEQSTIDTLLSRRPALASQFLRYTTQELDKAYQAIFQNAVMSNRGRFVHLLTILAERHGTAHGDGSHTVTLPLGRRDLASMIGTRHETLSRIISRLEADGMARFSGRTVHIPSLTPLRADSEVAGHA